MKRAFPTFITQVGKDFLVYVPDLDLYTEGNSLTDAIEMARDAIGLKGIDLEDDGTSKYCIKFIKLKPGSLFIRRGVPESRGRYGRSGLQDRYRNDGRRRFYCLPEPYG